jgi:hypothetical protein
MFNKCILSILLIGWSGFVYAEFSTMPTMPVDPRCGQVFCPITPPQNPCTINPNLCKPIQPDVRKCINGVLYRKVKDEFGLWIWEIVYNNIKQPVFCE